MTKSSYPLKLPQSVKAAAQRLAKDDGVSLNQWIAVAVAEKIGTVETASSFLQAKAGTAVPADMLSFLDRAGREAPQPSDKL